MSFNIPQTEQKRVVIVGGGFGGLELANKLKNSDFQVVLVDKNNYHQFQPLLYQVASCGLEAGSISFPFRRVFQNRKGFYFRMAEVKTIVPEKNQIETSIGHITYDYLIIAAGTDTNYFGNENLRKNALPMKNMEEATEIRNTILSNLERALTCSDLEEKQTLLNIVVVGGGATGVEVAGVLTEMKRFVLPKDYPDLTKQEMHVFLVEGSNRLLGGFSEQSSASAERFLKEMGVNVLKNKLVKDYIDDHVLFSDGTDIACKTLIWVSGVTANRFENLDDKFLRKGGRIAVNEFNQIPTYPNVFAIGDICYQEEPKFPNGHPQVAQVAIQQGALVARNIKRISQGSSTIPFKYNDKGSMATVGRNKAVAEIGTIKLQGLVAWLAWMLVHLRSILGVKNKIVVFIDWVFSYFTYDHSMRLIMFHRKNKR